MLFGRLIVQLIKTENNDKGKLKLRIGNRVRYKKEIFEVLNIQDSGTIFSSQGKYGKFRNISPISLNKELLLEYGFSDMNDGIYKYKGLTELFHTFCGFFFRYDVKFIASCKYLHELQNIFFALYKEEINFVQSAALV